MKFTKLSVSRGGTINTGNFNNYRFDISAEVEVQEGETADDAYVWLRTWVAKKAKDEMQAHAGKE